MNHEIRGHGQPAISVVISTLGSHETLAEVIAGYRGQAAPIDSFEVVVVADAAEPDIEAVREAIGEPPFSVRQLRGDVPGLSANRNVGWRAARAPLVLFTDNDTIPWPELISEHLRSHEVHPEEHVGVVGLVRWDPRLRVTTFMRWLDTGIQFDFANMREGDVGWGRFCGANVSLKRAFVEKVGAFDQDHFPYGYEDTDWAYRASKLRFQLHFNPDAGVDHLREMTLDFWKKRVRRVAMAERQFSAMYPETKPWFHSIFTAAARQPPARGRAARLASLVPRRARWVGPIVWQSVDARYKQELAPYFLSAWDNAESSTGLPRQPDLAEWGADG